MYLKEIYVIIKRNGLYQVHIKDIQTYIYILTV